MESVLAEIGRDPRDLYDMTFFDYEKIVTGWKDRVRRRREELAWFTYCIMRTQTKKVKFSDILTPFEERKTEQELLQERTEIYKKFGRDPDGNLIERE